MTEQQPSGDNDTDADVKADVDTDTDAGDAGEGGDAGTEGGEQPQPLPRTGVAGADAAAERLDELADAPLEEHVAIYEDVHRRLQEGLADLDEQ